MSIRSLSAVLRPSRVKVSILSLAASLFSAFAASATPVLDASSSAAVASSTSVSFNHTLGVGSGRLVVCTVAIANSTTGTSNVVPVVTFGGFAMTAIPATQAPASGSSNKIESEMFFLNDTTLGAASGSQAVQVTVTGAPTGLGAGCSSYFGMAQAGPEAVGINYQGNSTPAATITLTGTNAGDLIVDGFAGGFNVTSTGKSASANAPLTQLYSTQSQAGGVISGSSYLIQTGSTAPAISWTSVVSRQAYSAVAFAPTPIVYYTVTTAASPAGSGTITLSPNLSSYPAGSSVTVTANPIPNYTFTGFTGDLSGTTNGATLVVNGNKSVTANFAVAQCTLTMNVVGQGTVTPSSGTYNCGSTINLSATAASGYSFGQWSGGGYTGTANPTSFTLNGNITETATFVQGTTCTLGTSVTGQGSITLNPAGGSYSCGTSVQVTAVPFSADWTFNGFTGALTGATNPQTIVLNANSTVAASFTQTSFPVNVTIVGQGTVTPSPSAASYPTGTVVQLTAAASPGYRFTGYTGDLSSTANVASITVNSTRNITATFVPSVITPDATSHAATTGSQSSLTWTHTIGSGASRALIIAVGSSDSAASPNPNAVVTSLTYNGVYATPIPNSLISGGTSGSVQTQLFYLTEAELPAPGTYPIRINLAGIVGGVSAGAVSFSGVNQGPPEAVITHRDTSGADLISTSITTLTNNAYVIDVVEDNNIAALTANAGQTVVFTQSATLGTAGMSTKAVATAGPTTLGWAGSASRLTHSLAAFPPATDAVPPTYTLTLTATPGGTVSSNPNIATLPVGTGVLLTATPALGYAFAGWSGDVTSTVNPLAVTFDANHSIIANFVAVATCSVTYTVIGSGTVSPAANTYNCGTTINLNATPGAGYTFAGYSGDFVSTDNPAIFTVSQNSSVTVEFDQVPLCNLTVNTVGQGSVTPASGAYACNSVITLQATAANGYGFSGFTGDVSSTTNPTQFVLDQDKTVTATFAAGSTCTFSTSVVGNGTITPAAGTYACGTTLTVAANPGAKYIFNGFGGALSGTTSPVSLTLDSNKAVSATFVLNTAGVTGDSRTVTEPLFPTTFCSVLTAVQSTTSPVESQPDTARVQAAINACPAGQAVRFSANGSANGFIIAPITLKAGVTMFLDPDVTIMASINSADYACVAADSFCTSLISIATNLDPSPGSAIMGYGVIDGRGGVALTDKGKSWWATGSNARPRMIYLGNRSPATHADNFTMYKVTLRNSPKFHISGIGDNQTIWGIKILAPPDSPNTDGYDPSGSKNLTITQSYISTGDDMIAVKAGTGHVSNVTISNDHFYSGHGISIGSETNAGLNNMLVRDVAMDNGFGGSSANSLRIKSDVSRGGEVYDVLYKNVCVLHGGDVIVIDPYYSSGTGTLIPNFHDITFSNLHLLIRDSSKKSTMVGYNTGGTVNPLTVFLDNVTFDNYTANDFKAPDNFHDVQFTLGPGPVNFAPTLQAIAAIPGNNITVNNGVSNSNAPLDCSAAFVYLAGDLGANNPSITAGASATVQAVLQNIPQNPIATGVLAAQQHAPTGTINILEGGNIVGTGTISGRVTPITINAVTAGTHTYTAQYQGDSNFAALPFGTVTINAMVANNPPTAASQSVTVGYNSPASITLAATGTGTLTYSIVTAPTHGTLSGTAPAVTYTPTPGYSGPDTFTFKASNGSDSNIATVSLTIQSPTTTLSLATPSPSTGLSTNQTTTLTATLSPTTAGANTATGTITFSDSGTAICQGVAFNSVTGVATCVTPPLTLGTHTFTASYAGDTHFGPSTSNPQSVSVSSPLASLTVIGFPSAAHIGTAYTVTVTAKDSTGTPITGYTGTVTLGTSAARATLPAPYTFLGSENGVHTFTITLNTGGTQTITASSGAVSGTETGIVVDDFIWVLNSTGTLSKLAPDGSIIISPIGTSGPASTRGGIAFDATGNAWSVDNASSTLLHATSAGASPTNYAGGGLNLPIGIAIDGAGTSWIANTNNTLSVFANDGSNISPATGYEGATTNHASPLNTPSSITVDNSGSVWITNRGNGTVTKVFGAATPVVTPTSTGASTNTLGTRP